MHCCASSAAREETLIPWTSDPSGRRQSQQKSEFRRTTDLPCHANTAQIGACSGKIGSGSIYRQLKRLQGRTLVWSFRSGWTVARIAFRIIEDLAGDWRRLDERVERLSKEIEAIARRGAGCERLISEPGIGPIISSVVVAAIGAGDVFSKGRDFAAWLGLVPRQISTGDRTILGKISKRGNRYLRVRAGRVGGADQAEELGASRAQVLD